MTYHNFLKNIPERDKYGNLFFWNNTKILNYLNNSKNLQKVVSLQKIFDEENFLPKSLNYSDLTDENKVDAKKIIIKSIIEDQENKNKTILLLQFFKNKYNQFIIFINDINNKTHWLINKNLVIDIDFLEEVFQTIINYFGKHVIIIPHYRAVTIFRDFQRKKRSSYFIKNKFKSLQIRIDPFHDVLLNTDNLKKKSFKKFVNPSHIDFLEAESIHIIREAIIDAKNPVMLYSLGKDSSVLLHLALKAFYPKPVPFPLLHVDTKWKFNEMYKFRDYIPQNYPVKLIVYVNTDGAKRKINPFINGSDIHTDIMKTQALKLALKKHKFDLAFGGARRDEEKSRSKERVFSFRNEAHYWDAKNQRPELWNLYNGLKNENENIRVFPLSNWTELDVWQYIYRENIPIVPLYFAKERPVIIRNNTILMIDDDRFKLLPKDKIQLLNIRFRTLGCYPLTGAILSNASSLEEILLELFKSRTSERQGRLIDTSSFNSMEKKKQEGYF